MSTQAHLSGTLIRAGTFRIGDEEITGYVIACPPEAIAQVKHFPMFRPVIIFEGAPAVAGTVSEVVNATDDYIHYVDATDDNQYVHIVPEKLP